MRAIIVKVTMESGKRCSVPFDRYGLNAGLFATAAKEGWDEQRTINQAVSEALAGALREYPGDRTIDYRVTTV